MTRVAFHLGPGHDGQWLTADDEIADHTDYVFDGNGNMTRSITFWNSGMGGDTVLNYQDMTYDGKGNLIREVDYTDPGPDGIWF